MIAKRNLELCFPELNQEQQQNLLLKNFEATGIAIFETGMAWFWSRKKLQNKVSINNFDELQALVEQKRGVLLVVFHFTTLEMLGAFTNYLIPTIHMTYRPHNNAVYDFVQARQRARHNTTSTVLDRDNVRGMLKSLKTGHCISYLPDQDYGRKQSVFVPFFGVVAATVTASSRLAAMAQTPVIPLMCVRQDDGSGYVLEAMPALENYPSDDPLRDAEAMNNVIEHCIRRCPEQYLWVHRRFKTRPEGEASLYKLPKKKRKKRKKAKAKVN